MTMRWAAWAALTCVVGLPVAGYAEQFTLTVERPMVLVNGRVFLLSEDGHALRDGTVTPAGLALCAAMKIAPDRPCEWDVIVDASRSQTDPALWVDQFGTSTDGTDPESCWQPVLLETYPAGGKTVYVHGCHVQHAFGVITPEMIERLAATAKRLQSASPKTLAQHRAAAGLMSYTDELEKAAQ
jgi:hypothetical protein